MFENEKFDEILTVLRRGGVILYPTDTIWGVGCDATNSAAVERILEIKNRPAEKGLVLLVSSIDMLKRFVQKVHPRIETLLSFHDRPLTVIYENPLGLASNVLAKDGTVAIRIVQDYFCKELIGQLGKPIVATSANIGGQPFPTHFGEISSDVLEEVDFVVKYKQDSREKKEPSVIVKLNDIEELDFIRE